MANPKTSVGSGNAKVVDDSQHADQTQWAMSIGQSQRSGKQRKWAFAETANAHQGWVIDAPLAWLTLELLCLHRAVFRFTKHQYSNAAQTTNQSHWTPLSCLKKSRGVGGRATNVSITKKQNTSFCHWHYLRPSLTPFLILLQRGQQNERESGEQAT